MKLYHVSQATALATIGAIILFCASTTIRGCASLANSSHDSISGVLNETPRGYMLSNEEAGYDQAQYDECRDSADDLECNQ